MADKQDDAPRPEFSKTASRQPTRTVGNKGPQSSLQTEQGSPTGVSSGDEGSNAKESGALAYDVQTHTDEKGLEVIRVTAASGDEAASKALAQKGFKGVSIRGVTPASDPDPNSLGGERDASIMYYNAENLGDAGINPLGTEANVKATEKLGKADVKELGE